MPSPEDVESIALAELPRTRASHELARVDSKATVDVYPLASGSTSRNASNPDVAVEDDDTAQLNESSLAPVDGGWRAWSFLIAAFVVELAIWGFPNAFGVFLEAYLRDTSLVNQPHAMSLLPLAGTLSSGIIFCTGALTYPLSTRYPYYRRHAMWIGVVVCWAALFGASFAKKLCVSELVFFQGVLYALGASILYAPAMSYMAEWFARRRGLASGVIDAGTAAGGLIFPLFLPQVIEAHGTALTLRYISYGFLATMIPTLAMIKPRLPERRAALRGPGPRASTDKSWMTSGQFWLVVVANTVQGFAYFLPGVWLPTYASALNISASKASLTVAILNGASLLSRLALGTLSDYFAPWLLAAITLSTASLATFIFWGVIGHALAGLLVFGLSFGIVAGGWTSLWTGFLRPVVKEDRNLYMTLMGILMCTRGLGNVLSTPLATALSSGSGINATAAVHTGFAVAGGKYKDMIVYVGTCFAAAAVIAAVGLGREMIVKRRLAEQ
ncbi:unnamed protein product [Peniophora sp. CBMAI 1063]|nr:unnamed protein product [Peniophora sp. CBMAI 1063]